MEQTPKGTFDSSYPSGNHAFSGYSSRNAFLSLYEADMAPLRPLAHDNPDMKVMVLGTDTGNYMRGIYYGNNSQRIPIHSGDSPLMSAPASYPRIDLVYVDPSGDVFVKVGTEAVSPQIPSPPSGDTIPVCAVYHPLETTKIVNFADRESYSGDSYIMADLRPFYKNASDNNPIQSQETDRNTKNIMLNRIKIQQSESLTAGKFVDGWTDDFQDSSGLNTTYTGDLVTTNDKLRRTRNHTYRGTPNFDVIKMTAPSGDQKLVIVTQRVGFDFLADKAIVMIVTESGDNISCDLSRNNGTSWNPIPIANEFFDGTYYYKSGTSESITGDYAPPGTGDYMLTIVAPSGSRASIEAYGVTLA